MTSLVRRNACNAIVAEEDCKTVREGRLAGWGGGLWGGGQGGEAGRAGWLVWSGGGPGGGRARWLEGGGSSE